MVKLTVEIISRSKSAYTKKKPDETTEQYLSRLTHLYLEGRNIDETDDELGMCSNLSVLYLYDNILKEVPVLSHNKHLTHLFLQNNRIQRIHNLHSLRCLVKLYLGHNCINVLEGLEDLKELIELRVENQLLPLGEKLLFDPRSIDAISKSLQVLDISGNKLDSIKAIEHLVSLNHLVARDNKLMDLEELGTVLRKLRRLVRLDFTNNPLCGLNKYRDHIILMANNLDYLDGKEVSKMAKDFILKWYASRDAIRKKNAALLERRATMLEYPQQLQRSLPPMEGGPQSYSGFFMPGLKNRQFDEVLAKSATTLNPSSQTEPIRTRSDILSNSSSTTVID